jgi:hypothetical protein
VDPCDSFSGGRLDYWLTQATLWLVDVVCGPMRYTAAPSAVRRQSPRRAALIGCASAIATVLTMILVGASGGSGV